MPKAKQGPKVSIILPVYKGANYLAQSIESVITQTYENWELIIVDDNSPDDSFQIAQTHAKKDNRIKAYKNEKNLMLPGNLNAGFGHATGTYYTWTSHDNAYLPDALEKMVAYLEKTPACTLVYADMLEMNPAGETFPGPARKPPTD